MCVYLASEGFIPDLHWNTGPQWGTTVPQIPGAHPVSKPWLWNEPVVAGAVYSVSTSASASIVRRRRSFLTAAVACIWPALQCCRRCQCTIRRRLRKRWLRWPQESDWRGGGAVGAGKLSGKRFGISLKYGTVGMYYTLKEQPADPGG